MPNQPFSYLRGHETAPGLAPDESVQLEAPAPVNLRKWVQPSFARATPMITRKYEVARLDEWATSPTLDHGGGEQATRGIDSSLFACIGYLRQAADSLSADSTASSGKPGFDWLKTECIAFAAQRAALAQRTYLWLSYWRKAADEIDATIRANPEVKKHPQLSQLLEDITQAHPRLAELKVDRSDERKGIDRTKHEHDRLQERVHGASLYAGALLGLHDFLVCDKHDLPPELPPRTATQCLGQGSGWLLAQLYDVGGLVAKSCILSWPDDACSNYIKMVANGTSDEAVPDPLRRIFVELGLNMIVDAEGIVSCVCVHEAAVERAKENPSPTIIATFVEAHLLALLHYYVDAVYATAGARHSYAPTPSSLPKPEDTLKTKLAPLYNDWLQNYDPQPQ